MSNEGKVFAIESFISSAYYQESIRAVGYFLIKINGISYGVKEDDATALANSYDSVIECLETRGRHTAPADLIKLPALELAQLVNSILYDYPENEQYSRVFGISKDDLVKLIYKNGLIWKGGLDEAFNDGSSVLQFDIDNETVRLIGYKVTDDDDNGNGIVDISTLTDLIISSDEYYLTLKEWADGFYKEWQNSEKENYTLRTLIKVPDKWLPPGAAC